MYMPTVTFSAYANKRGFAVLFLQSRNFYNLNKKGSQMFKNVNWIIKKLEGINQ